jgi:hypothetical protein
MISEADNLRALLIVERYKVQERDITIAELRRADAEAAEHVESVICTRTNFTGHHPYVGWKGLGLALVEALDERDKLRAAGNGLESLRK